MAATPALICIPDITGFTEFMSETDLKISKKVIPSLLNEIIYANEIGLKVSEIEGDSVLFYRMGKLPSCVELITQCGKFYTEFNKRMQKLKTDNYEILDYRNLPENLGLKIILHYGDLEMMTVGKHIKLVGEEVIVAHRLLKNNISLPEYVLLSENLSNNYGEELIDDKLSWANLKKGSTEYDHIGEVEYHYADLKPLLAKNT